MKTKYESGVGSINWAANNTRPDLSLAANSLASRAADPTQTDFSRLVHCLGYISTSLEQKLNYDRTRREGLQETFTIKTFSDASYAPSPDVKSIFEMTTYINRNPVKWLSKKQKNITRSTAAAELVALSGAEDRTVHLVELLNNLGFKVQETKLYEDNQAVIACCDQKSLSHTRKMVDLRKGGIRERLYNKFYSLEYVSSGFND